MTDFKIFEQIAKMLYDCKTEFKKIQNFVIKNISIRKLFEERQVPIDGITTKCPFHDTETMDAGRFSEDKGTEYYYCNNPTCSMHGKRHDVISVHQAFLTKETGLTVSYTIAMLDLYCNVLNQEVPQFTQREQTPEEIAEEKDKYMTNLLFLHIVAIAKKLLADPTWGEEGRKYLSGRKISGAFCKAYHIGWLPSGYKLSEELEAKGFSKEFLAEKGIISKTSGNDTLFNRIVIPMWAEYIDVLDPNFVFRDAVIENLYTRTAIIKTDRDKTYKHRYINRELPFFNIKSCLGKQNIILVEGIIDCLSIQDVLIKMRGLVNSGKTFDSDFDPVNTGVAATYGTNGLSEETMKKYLGGFKNIYLAADNDDNNAGQTANIKRAKVLAKMFPKANVKLVTWNKKDANDMLVSGAAPEEFWTCIEKSISLEEFCIKTVIANMNKNKGDIKTYFDGLEELKPYIEFFDVSDELRLFACAKMVSEGTNIPLDIVLYSFLKTKVSSPLEIIAKLTEK